MEWLDSVFTVLALFAAFYFYAKYKQSYWERLGVPYVKPTFLLGQAAGGFSKIPLKDRLHDVYKELKPQGSTFGGFYLFTSPVVMILDPGLLKTIFIKDFHHFYDRGFYNNEKSDPLSAHLLSLTGNKWKVLRGKLTPTFTSGRMKMMFPIIYDISKELTKTAQEQVQMNTTVEIKDLMSRFTTDVIGNCVFGLECNSLKNPNTEFRKYGAMAFTRTPVQGLKQTFLQTFPKIGRFFNMMFNDPKVTTFFMRIVREIVDYREKSTVVRHDFMNLLINLMKSSDESEKLTFNELAAQVFLFFLAGFETSSTTMMYCLYELALNPAIQTKTREHINHVLQQHNNEVTYEAIMDMTYLDQVINETLRKYPVITNLIRVCTQEYKIPGSDVTLPVGTNINIPVYGIHNDPEYYPNPDKFDPERFTKEEIAKRPQCSYIPFGEGPRICIGQRFGLMQTKVGLIALISSSKFSKCSETMYPLTGFPLNLPFITLEEGIKLRMENI